MKVSLNVKLTGASSGIDKNGKKFFMLNFVTSDNQTFSSFARHLTRSSYDLMTMDFYDLPFSISANQNRLSFAGPLDNNEKSLEFDE